jgi:hypothetical protein
MQGIIYIVNVPIVDKCSNDHGPYAELLQVPGEPRSNCESKMETSPPVQNGSSSIDRESLTQSSEKAKLMEEHFDTGLVTVEALSSDRIERDEQTQWNPKTRIPVI